MSVSAPSACACAATSASLRTLFPPKANGIESSRFTTRRGPPPSTADNRGRGSTGVGRETTDSAVGAQEEDNLRHLVTNLGHDVPRERIVPFLTAKHTLDYCFSYAERAQQHGFSALVVLGGDKSVGIPRCVGHAWQLRQLLRERTHTVALGGWANPHRDPERQVDYLVDAGFNAEFYLTQVVSHFDTEKVSRFVRAAERRGVALPGLFGIFFYRSANARTLDALQEFLPVPAEQ